MNKYTVGDLFVCYSDLYTRIIDTERGITYVDYEPGSDIFVHHMEKIN